MDRDGTLSHEVGYVNHLSRFRLFPYAVDAVRLVNRSGFLAVLVTNQAGVARGYFPESLVHEVHAVAAARRWRRAARASTAIYFCPHHPTAGEPPYRQDCDCRKPRPGPAPRAPRPSWASTWRAPTWSATAWATCSWRGTWARAACW